MDEEINKQIAKLQASRSPDDEPLFVIRPLAVPPRYGVFRWWPTDKDWIHPGDVETAKQLIPSERLFRKEKYDDVYFLLTYGEQYIRIKHVIWLEIKTEGYELGDQVEVTSRLGKGHPMIATITEICWDKNEGRLMYTVVGTELHMRRKFSSEEFQLTHQIGTHLDERKTKLIQKARFG